MSEHTETAVETMEPEGVDTVMVLIMGAVFSIVLFVIIVLLIAWFRASEQSAIETKTYSTRNDALVNLVSDQKAELELYGVVDAKAGVFSIPIDVAIDLIASENSFKAQMDAVKNGAGDAPAATAVTVVPKDESRS